MKPKAYTKFLYEKSRNYLYRRPITNIYHASVQKTGSQWIKAVLSDSRIRRKTGLTTYPQHRYEWDEFKKRFPKHSFVPGLYLSYQAYEEIVKPGNYKTLYVYRDPRDTVVSWYYSMKYSHGLMGKVYKHRKNLEKLNELEGISYCIRHFHLKLSYMKDWKLNCEDSNVVFLKFEELTQDPLKYFKFFFDECNIDITKNELNDVLKKYTKEKMQKKEDSKEKEISHYGDNKKSWKDLFTKEHHNLFKSINGNILHMLGYEG